MLFRSRSRPRSRRVKVQAWASGCQTPSSSINEARSASRIARAEVRGSSSSCPPHRRTPERLKAKKALVTIHRRRRAVAPCRGPGRPPGKQKAECEADTRSRRSRLEHPGRSRSEIQAILLRRIHRRVSKGSGGGLPGVNLEKVSRWLADAMYDDARCGLFHEWIARRRIALTDEPRTVTPRPRGLLQNRGAPRLAPGRFRALGGLGGHSRPPMYVRARRARRRSGRARRGCRRRDSGSSARCSS